MKKNESIVISRKNKSYMKKKKERNQILLDEAMERCILMTDLTKIVFNGFGRPEGKSREYIGELGCHPVNGKPIINT